MISNSSVTKNQKETAEARHTHIYLKISLGIIFLLDQTNMLSEHLDRKYMIVLLNMLSRIHDPIIQKMQAGPCFRTEKKISQKPLIIEFDWHGHAYKQLYINGRMVYRKDEKLTAVPACSDPDQV